MAIHADNIDFKLSYFGTQVEEKKPKKKVKFIQEKI
jgi:hypothetical protein